MSECIVCKAPSQYRSPFVVVNIVNIVIIFITTTNGQTNFNNLHSNAMAATACLRCPYGALCGGGTNVFARAGFWEGCHYL